MDIDRERPLSSGLGSALKPQSRSPCRLSAQSSGSVTLGKSSSPPASSSRTLTAGFSANLRATTQPEDPAPQTMKS
jgi:hypothetical protein